VPTISPPRPRTQSTSRERSVRSPIPWDRVERIVSANEEAIPGDPKDEKRVSKKKDLDSLDAAHALDRMSEIIDKGRDKKTPSCGKRDLENLAELLGVARERLVSGSIGDVEVQAPVAVDQDAIRETIRETTITILRQIEKEYGCFFSFTPVDY